MKIPGRATISNRTSTMASQLARARAPYIIPTVAEFDARYRLLGIDPNQPACAYCGGPPTEWDHLMPMVTGSRWTGYFTEIANLIPACGKCNQSRGSKAVGTWMRSLAPWSPRVVFRMRDGLPDAAALGEVDRRVTVIEQALIAQPPHRMTIIDDSRELALESCREELNLLLHRAENLAAELRAHYQRAASLSATQHLR